MAGKVHIMSLTTAPISTVLKRLSWCFLLLAVSLGPLLSAAHWPQFRGADGSGVSPDRSVPVEWSDQENLRWKSELPGPGNSSPIVWGGRVFLTSYSGYGADRTDPGELADLKRHVLCLDARTGKTLWSRTVKARLPEDPYRGFITEHGYASSTPVTDGERVYVFFGKSGVTSFDAEGTQIWQTFVGQESGNRRWGSAASPILAGDYVIVNAAEESQSIRALDKKTGKEIWRAESSALENVYSTPLLVTGAQGRQDLLVSLPNEVWGLNPENGKLRWLVETGIPGNVCPSMIHDDEAVYAFGGFPRRGSVAIRLGGKGDVTQSHRLWETNRSPYVPTPVLCDGHLFWVNRQGIVWCLDAKDGQVVYQERLDSQNDTAAFYASPVVAGGKIYAVSRKSGTFVLLANSEFQQIAQNRIASDPTEFNGTPAISNGRLYIRSHRFLYCLGTD